MAGGMSVGRDFGLFLLRAVLGVTFILHGLNKLTLVNPNSSGVAGFADYLASLGIPSPYIMAYLAIAAEIGGGALVLLGIFAQLGALAIAGVMVVAILKVHIHHGYFLPASAKEAGPLAMGYEYDLALLAMALCIALAGPGALSLGSMRKGRKEKGPPK